MAVLDWLQQLLGGGDPEAQGQAAASTAMMPAVNQWAQNVGSGQYAQQGLPSNYDPNQSFAQNALNPSGLENALNVALGVGGGSGLGIKAYHGSPYDFSAFDASKIGTGEGAQAYGHGLYFAENPAVTEQYRKMNLGMDAGGNLIYPPGIDKSKIYYPTAEPQARVDALYQRLDELNSAPKAPEWDATVAKIHEAQQELDAARSKPTGRMYEVDINAEPDQFLNWDKPLSEQPQAVQQALANTQHPVIQDWLSGKYPDALGQNAYNALAYRGEREGLPSHAYPQATEALNQAGIPGIRYLDQGSRGAGQGTSNYVVFDPSIIEILRKYGIIPPAVGAGLLGAADQQ